MSLKSETLRRFCFQKNYMKWRKVIDICAASELFSVLIVIEYQNKYKDDIQISIDKNIP